MVKEYLKIAIKNLRTRPLRSWLTILGIIIGIFLITSLISLSEGLKGAILSQLRMMGKDLIIIFPGELNDMITAFAGGLELSEDDVEAVKRAEGVVLTAPVNYKAEAVRYQGKNRILLINGNPWKEALDLYQTDIGWSLSEGRWPIVGKKEIIVGSLVPTDIFPGMKVGEEVTIKGRQFKVVGILKSLASKQDDSMIAMDMDIFRQITGVRKEAKMIVAKAGAEYSPDKVAENIKKELTETRKRKKGEDLPSFSVLTSEKVTGIVGNIMAVVQLVIFGFASIAIIVGGIGIMNTMYTSVRERTREIGILKAVGAKNLTISYIFLIESGIIGLIGGIGGTFLGFGLAKAIEILAQVHPVFYIEASTTPGLAAFSLIFSFLVGCLSGFFPARAATKLKPVDALRYE